MKRVQKEKVLDFIGSLRQAHREIKSAWEKKDLASAGRMLGECQEFAIRLGESIEEAEGEDHPAVRQAEAYCEALFQAFEETDSGKLNTYKEFRQIERQLAKLESCVKHEISVRKEVVFFPYQASMWDSLESVYLAAEEDPECDAYCVPIPYFEKGADGSLGEMRYEGGLYPKNIRITDWQEYRFEERKPDEIYIQNPYDNWNLVTTVHPRFYSENLKKYTDCLIYIPYFLLKEIDPDNQRAVDGMKHFIWLPGVIYADRVIVQSEKMKQIYVNEYLKAARAAGLRGEHTDRRFLEKKFLGLGSPKVDKVLKARREDQELPEGWGKILRKPDGSPKKVVFYNTGIAALLANNEKWLDKTEDSLKIFRENQEECALLWRPHPLIESTLKSMRPGLLRRFLDIKEQYIREGWGIFDGTADLDRAIALSDAYYGDASSVVQLFQAAGKPVMIQSCEVRCSQIGTSEREAFGGKESG